MGPVPTIIYERRGQIALFRFNRIGKHNAINGDFIFDLKRLVENVEADVKAIILCAYGEHFCSGLDLAEHEDRSPFDVLKHSRLVHGILDNLQFGGRPVIASMHGGVIGGGLEIASAAHIRVADKSTFYRLPEGKRGIFVGGGASVRVARILGATRLTDIMLTGRTIDAEEGQRLSLSHYLTEKGSALDKALELAEVVAENAQISNYMILEGIARIAEMNHAEGLFTESLAAAIAQSSEDARAGISAFLRKQAPQFNKQG